MLGMQADAGKITEGGGFMFQRFGVLAAAAALVFASNAHAGGLKPIEARSFSLGTVTGIVYYTPDASGYRVVATMMDAADGTVMRFIATLGPGQSMTLSTPRDAGEPAIAVQLVRRGDGLFLDGSGVDGNEAGAAHGTAVTELTTGQ